MTTAPAAAPQPEDGQQPESRALSTNVNQPSRELAADWLTPTNLAAAMDLARLMADAKLVPQHLQKSVSDCLLVISQAARWKMDPFAVAQGTAVVRGKLCFEGKLVAAALVATGAIEGGLDYEFEGEGQGMSVVVIGTLRRSGKRKELRGNVKGWRTENGQWDKDPMSMLAYRGSRQWARLYAPETIMGVATPDEVQELPVDAVVTGTERGGVPDAKAPKQRKAKGAIDAPAAETSAAPTALEPLTPEAIARNQAENVKRAELIAVAQKVFDHNPAGAAEVRAIANQCGGPFGKMPAEKIDEAMTKVKAAATLLGVTL